MSDTPETDEQINGKPCTRFLYAGDSLRDALVPSEFARKLERERNRYKSDVEVITKERDEARNIARWLDDYEAMEALLCEMQGLRDELVDVKRDRDEQTAQMCQAIGYLSTVAEDCEAWLNGESDEPSMEFIKAVRDYARKVVNQ